MPHKGYKQTEEHKRKVHDAMQKHWESPEYCLKISTSMLGKQNCITHGHTANGRMTAEFRAWCSMIQRCTNRNHPNYPNYGGRGIVVCSAWLQSFESFLADVGERPGHHLSLDRVDNDGHYQADNVRWATKSEQRRNQRPRKRRIEQPCA